MVWSGPIPREQNGTADTISAAPTREQETMDDKDLRALGRLAHDWKQRQNPYRGFEAVLWRAKRREWARTKAAEHQQAVESRTPPSPEESLAIRRALSACGSDTAHGSPAAGADRNRRGQTAEGCAVVRDSEGDPMQAKTSFR